jgi:hypothetical protein
VAGADADQVCQLGQGLFRGHIRVVQMSRAGMWLTCQQLRVGCEAGGVAVRRAGAAGEHGWEGGGQRDVVDLGNRAQTGEDRRGVGGVEEAVSADDDGVPAVVEQRDGQLCGLGDVGVPGLTCPANRVAVSSGLVVVYRGEAGEFDP